MTLNDEHIAQLVSLVPNLKDLSLSTFRTGMPCTLDTSPAIRSLSGCVTDDNHSASFPLAKLCLSGAPTLPSTHDVLRVLPFFEAEQVILSAVGPYVAPPTLPQDWPCDQALFHRPIRIRNLSVHEAVRHGECATKSSTSALLDGLANTLAPDVLQHLTLEYGSAEALQGAERLLARAGQSLLSLQLHARHPGLRPRDHGCSIQFAGQHLVSFPLLSAIAHVRTCVLGS